MSHIPPFDTLEMTKKLEGFKFDRVQAEGLAKAMAEAMQSSEIATKGDVGTVRDELKETKTELKAEIDSVRTELKTEIAAVRTELKAEIDSVRTELKTEIAAVRTELKAEILELKSEIKALDNKIDKVEIGLKGEIKAIADQNKLILGLIMGIFAAILALAGLAIKTALP